MEATHILASHTRSSDTCETSIDDIYISGAKVTETMRWRPHTY